MSRLFAIALAIAGAAAGDYSHGHGHGHSHSHSHGHYPHYPYQNYDPWANSSSTNPTSGWYSPYQQYSPPKIAYKPGPLKSPEYATCTMVAANNFVNTMSL